jgi:hypothetical protein
MPDASQVTPVNFPLQGGLVLNKSTFAMQPDINRGSFTIHKI